MTGSSVAADHNGQTRKSTHVVVIVNAPNGFTLPAAALPALRAAATVYVGADIAPEVFAATPFAESDVVPVEPAVLIATTVKEPGAAAFIAAGAQVIQPAPTVGDVLAEAVTVMDTLRSPGGCPWDAAQTHETLRKHLLEESYELVDALDSGDRASLREELGDVLLQVLFHARIAEEHGSEPFGIGDVTQDLIDKLVSRHAYIFSTDDIDDAAPRQVKSAADQSENWERSKQREKQRLSIMDGVALGQPAAALAGKVGQRSGRAGIPLDLLPVGQHGDARQLFRIAVTMRRADQEPELELRSVALRFADDIREAEHNARAAGFEPTALQPDDWRRFWPSR